MYKVMLIQENLDSCKELKQLIDWKELNCEVVSTVTNMADAVVNYRKLMPEIVITDIMTNDVDLTSMILDLRQHHRATQIIVISDQDDYHYVRNALKAGVFDYLLRKELNRELLRSTLKDAIHYFTSYRTQNIRAEGDSIERLRQYMILYRNQHEVNEEEVREVLRGSVFDEYRRDGYQLAYFRIDNIRLLYESRITSHKQLQERLRSVIVDALPADQQYLLLFISNHSGVLVFKGMQHLRVMNNCNLMIREVQEQMNIEMSVTVGKASHDLNMLFQAYQYLLERHEARFYLGEKVIVEDEEIPSFQDLDPMATNYHLDFMRAMRTRDYERAEVIIMEILDYMKKEFIYPKQVKNYFVFLFSNVEGDEMQKGLQNVFHLEAWLDLISNAETAQMLQKVVNNTIAYIRSWIKDTNNNRYRDDITHIIEYIDENYTVKLSLKTIAEAFSMNESYLSRMFKNETGKNLIYFINEKKMRKAMELLEDPNMTIKKVANMVGINDQFYFNKVFKKFYHVSPSEYRKHQKQEI